MSKFNELCKLYNWSHTEMSDYLESCLQFVQNLIIGLEVYLECPAKRVLFRDKMGEDKPLTEALYLQDGFWHLDTTITMCSESAYRLRAAAFTRCYYPRQTILLPLVMKKITTDSFMIGIDGYSEYFTINAHDQSSFVLFYEFVYEAIKAYYENIFQLIIENDESPRKISFQHVKNKV
ncbi:hypothetical protein [Mastigocladopsis repens]|uniref:hypothetical protein n=1 Tax=Mastigocladopsis repens TaxID=221287 RepID=UPI00037D06C8|nr:hypothetical protein [Mastigocladopsis repens]